MKLGKKENIMKEGEKFSFTTKDISSAEGVGREEQPIVKKSPSKESFGFTIRSSSLPGVYNNGVFVRREVKGFQSQKDAEERARLILDKDKNIVSVTLSWPGNEEEFSREDK